MIERVGLLNNGLEEMVSTAWELYADWEFAGQPAQPDITTSLIDEFKDTFCRRNVKIHFMGLWDSVNSIGLFNDRMFPYTVRSSIVSHIRHAVSIDERRGKYKQVLFEPFAHNSNDSIRSTYESQSNNQLDQYTNSATGTPYSARSPLLGDSKKSGGTSIWSQLKSLFTGSSHRECERFSEDILELWFPGNHGDVGGGWPPDLDGQYLSDIPLRWMISEALKFGVKFKENELQDFHFKHPVEASLLSCHHDMLSLRRKMPMLHPSPRRFNWFKKLVKKTHKRNTLSQGNIEISPVTSHSDEVSFTPQIKIIKHLPKKPKTKFDAMGDSYTLVPLFWWLIELLPIGIKLEGDDRKWKKVYSPNLGRRRKLPKTAALHWSVFYRMHYIDDYNPQNLPLDVGSLVANSLAPFRSMYSDDEWEYISNLTKDQIKSDWNTPIWNTVPDDLFGFI
ncbi:Piso0_004154 [Millerozyma farinosa CBS 7064]|uniref:Piso0_004154 protein n=1 Tax=Pichia sorbitophila (strain ATCC MYA-4447 / BCRC 22081 / CBS 7064 / NBRC 10061 / NRRL Y-12695) TaxID=559304 RepID=G8Y7M5_PICSO|nr:Piso0_004154 [Millerozyma farinosa CBS 7064]CCE84605.1 Piso0_004154 [Millerozyma farinosa CBS 7064]